MIPYIEFKSKENRDKMFDSLCRLDGYKLKIGGFIRVSGTVSDATEIFKIRDRSIKVESSKFYLGPFAIVRIFKNWDRIQQDSWVIVEDIKKISSKQQIDIKISSIDWRPRFYKIFLSVSVSVILLAFILFFVFLP